MRDTLTHPPALPSLSQSVPSTEDGVMSKQTQTSHYSPIRGVGAQGTEQGGWMGLEG